ncbi:MAG: asparagine synthetase B [Brevinematia bacterium]
MYKFVFIFSLVFVFVNFSYADYLLIPMDYEQIDHLKPYGIVYNSLLNGIECYWILNYRGGSFAIPYNSLSFDLIKKEKVFYTIISDNEWRVINDLTNTDNINVIKLTKAPKIGLYKLKLQLPYDDAVELVLKYVNIPFVEIDDEDILKDALKTYQIDWLHFDHEDFTGQFGKFWSSYNNDPWYINMSLYLNNIAKRNGFRSVAEMKKAVSLRIRKFVEEGGFLFGMCAGTDTLDIALSSLNTDIVPEVFDGTPVDPNYKEKLDFSLVFAFKNFNIITDPYVYEYSDIDYPNYMIDPYSHPKYFYLKEFSAKYDPVSTMLVQDHTSEVREFLGQTTCFNVNKLKEGVVVLADYGDALKGYVKYIRGEIGKGAFSFLGGHDPEDFSHYVGDPPTDVSLVPNSPGYRLILNNVLFPASEKKKRKT